MLTNFSIVDPIGIALILFSMFLGGLIKGVTGTGMPIVAVPVIASFYDVPLAVAVLVIPNLLINIFQTLKFKHHNNEPRLTRNFAISGFLGAAIGTIILTSITAENLNLLISVILLLYIGLRINKPEFKMTLFRAHKLVWFAGLGGGFLQGAFGISAPIAVTFANAIQLDRPVFIYTMSVFFTAMCFMQIPLLLIYDVMTWKTALIGLTACVPIIFGVFIGDNIGKRLNSVIFDRVILTLLALLAFKLVINAYFYL